MSLVVWLPLNGDSKNQGTKQYTETINTLEYTSNGKITNKCMNSGRLQYDKNPLGMVGSICFWIYPKSADEGGDGKSQIIFGRNDSGIGERKWSLYLFSHQPSVVPHNTSLHSWGCQKDGSKDPNGEFTLTGVLKESAWNHVCVAHDLDYEYVYINGALKRKIKWDSNGTFTFDVGTPIIYGDFYNDEANYRLNDFRIYDHCLTQSEVSEIAKGLMLHYSFENPYVMETTNIPHSLTLTTDKVTMGTDSIGKYIIKPTGLEWYDGLKISPVIVKPGRYYTWSIEVMSPVDCQYTFDTNSFCDSSAHSGNDMHFVNGRAVRSSEVWEIKGGVLSPTRGRLEAYKWTKVWTTVKITSECSNPSIFHSICPVDAGNSIKMYYRNSMLEESPYPSPYIPSIREAGLIRDNSGMGNDGTQVYQREEIPIVNNSVGKVFTKSDFQGIYNEYLSIGYMNHNTRYHYIGSTICYEFDITLSGITKTSDSAYADNGGYTEKTDGTKYWSGGSGPVQKTDYTSRLNNFKDGTYHICIERIIQDQQSLDNAKLHRFDLVFGYITGTVTVSNLHAYYQNLDTSTLSLSDNSAIGTHSAYFNGKNFIDAGVVTPDYMDELTLSCWVYRDDWSISMNNDPNCPSIVGKVDAGGFGFKIEKVSNYKGIDFAVYYKDIGYAGNVTGVTNIGFNYSKLSPGWHLFTGIANKNKYSTYIDGELFEEQNHNINKPISTINNSKNKQFDLYVGAEVDSSTFALVSDMYVDDVRLYSTALSDEDIKALYNVRTKIDNKSNLYCNQLVETKQENLASDLSKITDFGALGCNCNINYDTNNRILTFTLTSNSKNSYVGPYILNKYYGGQLITNKTYRYSIYVKFSKSGIWKVGEERIINSSSSPFKSVQEYEAGKWYKIENEGVATAAQVNFIFYYCSGLLEAGDKIEIRDFKMYRLYDNENYNPGPNIKGQYKTFELNETFNEDVENSGATIVDKYGAEWLEVFYHDNNNCKVFFDSQTEALHTNSQYKFSILDQLEKFRGNDSKFEFLLEYPTDIPGKYNRWKQTDNPVKVTANNTYASGYQAIHVDWPDNNWGGLLRAASSNVTLLKGSIVNANTWFFAIGAIKAWDSSINHNGVPGPYTSASDYSNPNGIVHDIHLYVRIDNLPNKNEIFRQYKRQTKTKEIIEI